MSPILIACDSFKDALSAPQVCRAIEKGLKKCGPSIQTVLRPLSDGGEGALSAFLFYFGGTSIAVEVQDPLGRSIEATFGWSAAHQTAFVEMAEASGMELLKKEERNPFRTSTYGTGQLIQAALQRGARELILSIGGSATHDGGVGMALALGYRFFDQNGQALTHFPEQIEDIDYIRPPEDASFLKKAAFTVLCDVDNPLTGARGAAYTYAEQKGAQADQLDQLDQQLEHLGKIWEKSLGLKLSPMKGAGAAGGLGAGAVAFLNARMQSGIEYFLQLADIQSLLPKVNYIITGEGKIDRQTLNGKLIKGLVDMTHNAEVPVIALCGKLEPEVIRPLGLTAAFSISMGPGSLEEALKNTALNLEATAEQVGRVIGGH